jgi:hypothetical protein
MGVALEALGTSIDAAGLALFERSPGRAHLS